MFTHQNFSQADVQRNDAIKKSLQIWSDQHFLPILKDTFDFVTNLAIELGVKGHNEVSRIKKYIGETKEHINEKLQQQNVPQLDTVKASKLFLNEVKNLIDDLQDDVIKKREYYNHEDRNLAIQRTNTNVRRGLIVVLGVGFGFLIFYFMATYQLDKNNDCDCEDVYSPIVPMSITWLMFASTFIAVAIDQWARYKNKHFSIEFNEDLSKYIQNIEKGIKQGNFLKLKKSHTLNKNEKANVKKQNAKNKELQKNNELHDINIENKETKSDFPTRAIVNPHPTFIEAGQPTTRVYKEIDPGKFWNDYAVRSKLREEKFRLQNEENSAKVKTKTTQLKEMPKVQEKKSLEEGDVIRTPDNIEYIALTEKGKFYRFDEKEFTKKVNGDISSNVPIHRNKLKDIIHKGKLYKTRISKNGEIHYGIIPVGKTEFKDDKISTKPTHKLKTRSLGLRIKLFERPATADERKIDSRIERVFDEGDITKHDKKPKNN